MGACFLNFSYISKKFRVNDQIRVPNVRLITDEGEQLGVITTEEAMQQATEQGLDLVEVSPNAKPPVCKITDYGKMLYRQSKIDKKHRVKQKASEIKGIRLSIAIGEHDLDVKVKQAIKFLKAQHPLKVALILKGREMAYQDMAVDRLNEFAAKLEEYVQVDQEPKKQGYNVFMILSPKK